MWGFSLLYLILVFICLFVCPFVVVFICCKIFEVFFFFILERTGQGGGSSTGTYRQSDTIKQKPHNSCKKTKRGVGEVAVEYD